MFLYIFCCIGLLQLVGFPLTPVKGQLHDDSLFAKDNPELPHDESVENLGRLFPKMDLDKDGYVLHQELTDWINKMNSDTYFGEAKRMWKDLKLKDDQHLTWDHYSKQAVDKNGVYHDDDAETREANLKRDQRRFDKAAKDPKTGLSYSEAASFFSPETDAKMHDLLVEETIEEIDKNHDGMVDVNEYISDFWTPTEKDAETPEWVKSEKERFVQLDLNKDGKLDKKEVKGWLFPSESENVKAEVEHLFSECDSDKDKRLTRTELMQCFDQFTSSVATNYGDALTRHDEL